MSQQPIEVRLAQTYLDSFDKDPLLDLKDVKQYDKPNFIGKSGKFFLIKCYECPTAGDHGIENYHPNRPLGICTWCGWRYNTEIVAYIYAKMVVTGEVDINELRELKIDYHSFRRPITMPVKTPDCGMTIEEIRKKYPEQYDEALRAHKTEFHLAHGESYTPDDQEDDGEID